MRYRRCLSNELKGYRCVYVAHIYFILAFIFYNLKVSSLVRAWKISRGPHKLSFLSPPSFFMLHTVVPLMRLVTDQLSAGVQHNYLSFRFSTYFRILKHYGDETKQTVKIPSLPELILSEEKSHSSSTLHLNMSLINPCMCVLRVNGCLDNYV